MTQPQAETDMIERLARIDRNDLMFAICPDLTHTIHTGHLACEAAADAVEANIRKAVVELALPPGDPDPMCGTCGMPKSRCQTAQERSSGLYNACCDHCDHEHAQGGRSDA